MEMGVREIRIGSARRSGAMEGREGGGGERGGDGKKEGEGDITGERTAGRKMWGLVSEIVE